MKKQDLVKSIAKDTGFSLKDSKTALDSVLSNIIKMIADSKQLQLPDFEISENNRLILTDFGTFEKVTRQPRICTNPQTGEKVKVGEKKAVRFKPGRKFKEALM